MAKDALMEFLGSKKLMLAFLSLIAWLVAHLGLHFDPVQALAMASPFLVAIHAQGNADAGKAAAQVQAAHAWRVHAAMNPTATSTPPATPTKGAMSVAVVFAAAMSILLAVSMHGCAGGIKAVGDDLSACAKAEKDALSNGTSLIGVGVDVLNGVNDIKGGADPVSTIANLVIKYTEPVVACTVNKIAGGGAPATGSGASTSAADPTTLAARSLVKSHSWEKWTYVKAGAK